MITNPVIVTSLFDIGRDTWDNFKVSYHTYLWWMKNTLAIDANFVIYTDNRFYEDIIKMRQEVDPEWKRSKVINMYLHSLPSYTRYNKRLENLMYSPDFVNKIMFQVPEMTKPLYNTLIFNKLDFIKDAKDHNYFNGDLYIWVDAGGLREDISLYKDVKWPNINKVNQRIVADKITFFSHHPDFEVLSNESHAMSQVRHIQGGSIFCPVSQINSLHKLFNQTVNECINSGYIGSEEKMLDLTYIKNKSLYNIVTCDWREYYFIFK